MTSAVPHKAARCLGTEATEKSWPSCTTALVARSWRYRTLRVQPASRWPPSASAPQSLREPGEQWRAHILRPQYQSGLFL
jgi:hypothetical protein